MVIQAALAVLWRLDVPSALTVKQKQEGLLSPDTEFVRACTTALLPCKAPEDIF